MKKVCVWGGIYLLLVAVVTLVNFRQFAKIQGQIFAPLVEKDIRAAYAQNGYDGIHDLCRHTVGKYGSYYGCYVLDEGRPNFDGKTYVSDTWRKGAVIEIFANKSDALKNERLFLYEYDAWLRLGKNEDALTDFYAKDPTYRTLTDAWITVKPVGYVYVVMEETVVPVK
jgi:hypothetical protein